METAVLIAIISIIITSVNKAKKRNAAQQKRAGQVKAAQRIPALSVSDLNKIIKAEQAQLEKLRKEDERKKAEQAKQAEKIRTAQFKADQASNDMAYLEQLQRDLLKVYSYYEDICNDPDRKDKDRQAAYLKMLSYDTRLRNIGKKHEQAQFIIETFERLAKV